MRFRYVLSFLTLLLLCSAAPALAQMPTGSEAPSAAPDSFHVELMSGRILRGTVARETPLFKNSYLTLGDSARYELDHVRTFSTEDGYFRRVPDTNGRFARRTHEGDRISRFAVTGRTVWMNTPGSAGATGPGMGMPMSVGGGDYFTKDGGPLQEVEYSVLKKALADEPESLSHLRTHRTLKYTSWGAIAAGLGTVGVSVAGMESGDGVPTGAIVGAGIAAVGSWVPMFLLDGQLDNALDAYDR